MALIVACWRGACAVWPLQSAHLQCVCMPRSVIGVRHHTCGMPCICAGSELQKLLE